MSNPNAHNCKTALKPYLKPKSRIAFLLPPGHNCPGMKTGALWFRLRLVGLPYSISLLSDVSLLFLGP